MTIGPQAGMNFLLQRSPRVPDRAGRGMHDHAPGPDLLARPRRVLLPRSDMARPRRRQPQRHLRQRAESRRGGAGRRAFACASASCEFTFHQTEQPPTAGSVVADKGKETIVRDTVMGSFLGEELALSAIQDSEQAQDLLLLYQLSIKLLGCADPQEVIRESLDLLRDADQCLGRGISVGQRRWALEAEAGHPRIGSQASRPERIAHAAGLGRRARRVDRQPAVAHARTIVRRISPMRFACRWCRPARCWARFTCISSMAAFANRNSSSPSRSPTSRPWRWLGRGTRNPCPAISRGSKLLRPATTSWWVIAPACAI